jgi:hypothetical protein
MLARVSLACESGQIYRASGCSTPIAQPTFSGSPCQLGMAVRE